jgi:hypothetical protein
MDTWHSPPSIGIDKRKEYVVSKLKEGFELRVSPNRVRLFKAGQGYIPCALPIYRRLLAENIIIENGSRAGDQVFIFNPEVKTKGGSKKKPVIIDDDPLEEELTIEVPISLAELDAVDVEGADELLDAEDEEEEDLTDSFLDEEEESTDEQNIDFDEDDDAEEEEGYEDDDIEV